MEPRDVEPPGTQPSEVHDRRDVGEKTPEPHTQLPTPTATPLPNLTEPTSPPTSEPIEVDETPNLEEIEEENTLNLVELEVETGTNRVESEVETISNRVESEPEEGDALTRAPNDINGDVDESNILQTTRTRRPRIDPDFQSFYSKFHLQEEEEDREIRRAYTTAFNIGKTMPNRLHSNDLPPPPKSWKDLRTHPYREMFYTAARIEIEALKSKGTFDVVDKPVDVSKQVLPLLWVFIYKLDANRYLIKAKARICMHRDLQTLTGKKKYTATLAAKTGRLIFALAAAFDLDTHQLDAVNTFLNSMLHDEIYTRMPPRFQQIGKA
ncbi:hypothetical protein N7468_000039 [Penicillium chermesinum]|uniref:Reverse transcriptase Ty1/copia-type domain-containing protein n=1 Tax=Penicillium chermesinum TaxID=63820 RepID=A0A9W9PL54_9EURO|nr:uncharacterized protein N7468_000039 [Penicillium chermesinum]KAJ5248588.1 hypothetical protein N7468_000039 [Penicillium chermesinum]KAJ6150703.1 hypothetical protein N7470_007297 [Penicillium chermesinum]